MARRGRAQPARGARHWGHRSPAWRWSAPRHQTCGDTSAANPKFAQGSEPRDPNSKRADRKITQPQIRKAALLPIPKQGPVQSLPQQIIAAFDDDAHAFAKIAAFEVGTAAEYAAAGGIGTVEPERQRDAVAEQQIDILVAERLARGFRIGIGPYLGRSEHLLEEGFMRRA